MQGARHGGTFLLQAGQTFFSPCSHTPFPHVAGVGTGAELLAKEVVPWAETHAPVLQRVCVQATGITGAMQLEIPLQGS
jgi:hypothetical protein